MDGLHTDELTTIAVRQLKVQFSIYTNASYQYKIVIIMIIYSVLPFNLWVWGAALYLGPLLSTMCIIELHTHPGTVMWTNRERDSP